MASGNGDRHPALLALTSSALLLPAYQNARGDAPPEFSEVGVRYSNYQEDDIEGGKTLFGDDSERYDIDTAQFHLLVPVADDWSFAVDLQWEDMSGASPWFVGESANGDPKVFGRNLGKDQSFADVRQITSTEGGTPHGVLEIEHLDQ